MLRNSLCHRRVTKCLRRAIVETYDVRSRASTYNTQTYRGPQDHLSFVPRARDPNDDDCGPLRKRGGRGGGGRTGNIGDERPRTLERMRALRTPGKVSPVLESLARQLVQQRTVADGRMQAATQRLLAAANWGLMKTLGKAAPKPSPFFPPPCRLGVVLLGQLLLFREFRPRCRWKNSRLFGREDARTVGLPSSSRGWTS